VTNSKFGEKAYSSIRRFVIVAADDGHCQCVPILTYGGQATCKWGVKSESHAIVHMTDEQPEADAPAELAGEGKLSNRPIRVIRKTPRDKLEASSRINYAKIYTVEHNIKVRFIGEVAPESKSSFVTDFDSTWYRKRHMS